MQAVSILENVASKMMGVFQSPHRSIGGSTDGGVGGGGGSYGQRRETNVVFSSAVSGPRKVDSLLRVNTDRKL